MPDYQRINAWIQFLVISMTTLEITTQRERSESSLTGRYFSSSPRILLIILLLFAFSSQVNAQSSQTFNTAGTYTSVSYTHLRAHETRHDIVCRLLLEKK